MPVRLVLAITLANLIGCAPSSKDPRQTIATLGPRLAVGTSGAEAISLLERNGFPCRELARDQWTHRDTRIVRTVQCSAQVASPPNSYEVTYVSLGIDETGRIADVSSGAYGGGTYPAERVTPQSSR